MALTVTSAESTGSMTALMRARASHKLQDAAASSGLTRVRTRISPSLRTLRTGYARTLVAEDAITRMVGICEHFASARLLVLTGELLPDKPEFITTMWARQRQSAVRTWESRIATWNDLHRVNFQSDFVGINALLGFVEARNALAHGQGELTSQQVVSLKKVRERLLAAGIDLTGKRLVFDADTPLRCFAVSRNFIEWLEARALKLERVARD